MAYSRTPLEINVNFTFNEWREEINAAIERLNQLFNASDELEPMPGAIIGSPVINTPTITGGTQDSPTVTDGIYNTPTINNATASSGTYDGITITNSTLDGTNTFPGLGTAAVRDIGTGVSDVPVYSDLEAGSDSDEPNALLIVGSYLGQMFYDTSGPGWYIWNGSSWDQLATV